MTGTVHLQAALELPPFVYRVAYKTQCFADRTAGLVQRRSGGR